MALANSTFFRNSTHETWECWELLAEDLLNKTFLLGGGGRNVVCEKRPTFFKGSGKKTTKKTSLPNQNKKHSNFQTRISELFQKISCRFPG